MNGNQCPSCRAVNQPKAAFCSSCGTALPPNPPPVTNGRCTGCGYVLGSFSQSCPRCNAASQNAQMQRTQQLPPNWLKSSSPAAQRQVELNAPHIRCGACGNWVLQGLPACNYCGAVAGSVAPNVVAANQGPLQQVIIQTGYPAAPLPVPYRGRRDKLTAGLLGIFLGGLGIHHFYLRNNVAGVLSLLFCWTYIPGIIGLIQGIVLLCMDDLEFHQRYG